MAPVELPVLGESADWDTVLRLNSARSQKRSAGPVSVAGREDRGETWVIGSLAVAMTAAASCEHSRAGAVFYCLAFCLM